MPSLNSLYTVRSGLQAARRALEVVGQNISNANTVGYSRQEVSFAASDPTQVIQSAGSGVRDTNVLRYRDEFLDRHYRGRAGSQGYHATQSQALAQVEQILGDLSEGGLRTALDSFFTSWDALALNPTGAGPRGQIIAAAQDFVGKATTSHNELAQLRSNLDETIQTRVAEINNAAQQVASLNRDLLNGKLPPEQSSELMDRRDLLLDSLAKLAGATAVKQPDGSVTVHIGSLPLVSGDTAHSVDPAVALEGDLDPNPVITSTMQYVTSLTWSGTTNPVTFTGGEMAALYQMRDQTIPDTMKYLDNLVRTVATEVNFQHNNGVPPTDQVDIFDIAPNWMAIQVNLAVVNNPSLIIAAANVPGSPLSPAPSDGDRARLIAQIRDAQIVTGKPVGTQMVTPAEYLRSVHTTLGILGQQAKQSNEVADLQVAQTEKYRQSVSGVSLDDEMTKMVQYQQAYNAAARLMTTIDEMLDVVVNRLGITGR